MLYEFASPCFVGYSSLHFSRDPWQFSGHHGIWEDTDTDAQVGACMHAGSLLCTSSSIDFPF